MAMLKQVKDRAGAPAGRGFPRWPRGAFGVRPAQACHRNVAVIKNFNYWYTPPYLQHLRHCGYERIILNASLTVDLNGRCDAHDVSLATASNRHCATRVSMSETP